MTAPNDSVASQPSAPPEAGGQGKQGYDPEGVEARWYRAWEERNLFHADETSTAPPYCIVIPPPNVTGSLHMGHALNNTLQDILIRWHRMCGDNTLWMPGTDHAGIATQNVVERQLRQEGLSRDQLGREAFVERVWKWKRESGGTIIRQLRTLGASCDWARERFTLDPGLSEAVKEVFCQLYEAGLIYRGNYIINWCPRCQTALSDLEVEYQERDGKLWHLRYPLADGTGEVVVATTRPETMLGDTAVAVHPGGRAPGRAAGPAGVVARDGSGNPDHRRYVRGPRVRDRLRQGDPGARSQGLRVRPAPRSPADQGHRR